MPTGPELERSALAKAGTKANEFEPGAGARKRGQRPFLARSWCLHIFSRESPQAVSCKRDSFTSGNEGWSSRSAVCLAFGDLSGRIHPFVASTALTITKRAKHFVCTLACEHPDKHLLASRIGSDRASKWYHGCQ